MRSLCRIAVAVVGFVLFAMDQATAQPLIETAESLESFVINADRVWVARIIRVRDEPIPGGSRKPGITIAVEETLKYPLFEQRHEKMGLFVEHPTARFKAFEERTSRLLIAHSDHHPFSPKLIELAPGKVELFLADFTILRKPDAIVQAAREIISRVPPHVRQLHTVRLMIPAEVLVESKLGPYGQLVVPVDEQLEKRAIGFLKSTSSSRRSEAAKVLRYFKSDANIDRLRMLLADSGYSRRMADDRTRSKYFGVRDEAYQTLKAWGIEVERPVIVEPDSRQP
ncbi:hypothetical protein Enr13x_51620 [Stieleria neptunia]|uniref:Uncharacterized protein n=1 Tax=Stieleria neptunia TaxID=2527979 RepID=A0A518HWQ4_9BACT|nr:hypothetical protein [Stieleria neptunia]QDV45286.1 hypothetical protein Enr13x_51620 [Stieleria neptunia]